MIKKFFTFLCLCVLCIGSAWGETATLNSVSTKNVTDATTTSVSLTFGDVTCKVARTGGANNPGFYTKDGIVRYYKNDEMTLSVPSGNVITKIVFTMNSGAVGTASPTGLSENTWTGSSNSVTFKGSATVKINTIAVTYSSSTPTETYTVTFNAGAGSCSTASLTEASAGAGVTLPSCTASTGYVFKGWSTTENGTTTDAGKAGENYKPSSNCTLYAVYTKTYVLTITQPEAGGTLTVKNGEDTQLETGAIIEVGTNLTCEVTGIPEGKRFSRFYAKWGEGDKENKYKGTNPATFENLTKENLPENISALQIYVSYQDLKKYTINYYVNGVNTPQEVYEGTALVFPTVNDFGGKVFVGWSETEIAEAIDDKPELVNTEGLTATANATYYAVFATLTKGDSETKTDVLDLEFTGVDATSTYSSWSKSAPTSDAVYAGCSAGDKNSIQLRSKNSESGIVSTTTGGSVKKITVVWHNDTQNNRTLNVYGSNDAYTAVTELYDNEKSGTLIGTIVKGTNTELSISDEYAYIGLCSADGAMYLTSISIEWQQGTPDSYSAYCTSVAPRTKEVEITSAKYATLGLPYAVTIPEGVSAYTATVEDTKVTMTKIQTGKIPANCGVILYAETPKTYTFTETTTNESYEDNQLVAVVSGPYTCTGEDVGKVYYLGKDGEKAIFKKLNENGTIAAGKAYLKLDEALSGNAKLDVTFGEPTGITSYENDNENENLKSMAVYNLNGLKVNEAYKGIVIMNGKKYINK